MARRWLTEEQADAHQRFYSRSRVQEVPAQPPSGLNITLPMPPTVNRLYGIAPGGQKYLQEPQRAFREDVIGIVNIALRGNVEPFTQRLQLWMRLHFANKRRTDIDSRIKACLDALTHAKVYKDDSQIDKLTVERVVDPDGQEYCSVEIREMA
jgi:crossover junction endodeoxyribonuclease RusA